MTKPESESNAAPFSYQSEGEPEGKNKTDKLVQSEVLGENLPGCGPQSKYVSREVGQDRMPSLSDRSGHHAGEIGSNWAYIVALIAVLTVGSVAYVEFMPGKGSNGISPQSIKTWLMPTRLVMPIPQSRSSSRSVTDLRAIT